MDGEDRGDEGAGPKLAGHLPPDEKQRDRRSAACSSTLVRWCPQAFRPKSWQSSMCDSVASGYHSPNGPSVNAHADSLAGQPRGDMRVSKTKPLSS